MVLDWAQDQNGRPIRAMITEGTIADCSPAEDLRSGIQVQHLLADGVMVARLFFQKPIKLRCDRLFGQRKRENIREMTTKIETKGGGESKMRSGILNGGGRTQVWVRIQTLF